jgi:heme/copper-type cytochrome/quinol oxidase subunit 3
MAHEVEPAESPLTPESWIKLGMWVFLAGDAMSFGGLLAGYGALRYATSGPEVPEALRWPVPSEVLGVQLTAFMTFLLICSSVTMVKALAAIKEGDQRGLRMFLLLTISGGLTFLGLQAYEWSHLIHEGLGLASNPWGASQFGTTFFMTTGFHGCHVFGGVVYLSCVLLKGLRGGYSATNYNGVEAVGLYWHFVDLVWILVFTFVYLL